MDGDESSVMRMPKSAQSPNGPVLVRVSFVSLATLAALLLAFGACKTRGLFFLVGTLLVRLQALVYQNVLNIDDNHIRVPHQRELSCVEKSLE